MTEVKLTQEDMDNIIIDARIGDLEILQEIFAEIDPKLLLTIEDDTSKVSAVHMAAANGFDEVVKYLLSLLSSEDAKTLVNKQNEHGNTALHWAALNGHLETVKVLCEFGGDALIQNSRGHDAIYEAENNDRGEVSNWLLEHFAVEPESEDEESAEVEIQPGTEIKAATEESHAALENLTNETNKLNVE